MSVWSNIGNFFKGFGKVMAGALNSAVVRGLTDELIEVAKEWVKVAALQQLSNDKKREFVVKALVGRFPMIPESIIRLAVELAYQTIKTELGKH